MADIFFSHSSADNDIADWIKARLERERESWSVFLDRHPRDGILAGQSWQDRLRSELQSCRVVVAIITSSWLASRWCFTEAVTAAFRGKDFIGVVPDDLSDTALDAAPPIVHERQRQLLDMDSGAGWEEFLNALDRSGLDPGQWFSIPEEVGPYPGFVSFEEKDAGVFFGRDQEITQYLDDLNLLKASDRAQALVISGGSGSGKSSLLKAGLIPRLRRQPDWLIVPPFDPSREPIHALFSALRAAAEATGVSIDLPRDPPSSIDDLTTLLQNSLRVIEEKANAWLLLPLDQAEVLLAGSQEKTETDASRLLAAVWRILAGRTRKLVAVLTIRTEFMPALEHAVPAEVWIQDRSLRPITSLSEVIEKPAARFGIELEEGLTGRMVEDAKGPGGLPLLAYTLRQLNETYGEDKLLTVEEYAQLGGVEGAIERKLHEAFSDPHPTPQELAAVRRCFVRQLVRVDESAVEGERYLRTAVTRDALPAEAGRLVDRLLEAHLLVSDDSGAIGIAHERLIRNWADAPLQTWLAEDSKDRQLIDTLKSFLTAHREGGPLLSEKPLLDAKYFLKRDPSVKDDEPELAQFIQESVRAEQSRKRRRNWLFGGAIAAAVLFAAVAIGAIRFYLIAEERAVEAETSLAWSMLTFRSHNKLSANDAHGLWQIATSKPAAKKKSHLYLRQGGHHADKFARQPGEVIRALSLAPDPQVDRTLRQLMESKEASVRSSAIGASRLLGATDQAPAIAARLADENSGVREAAVDALAKLGATDQAPAIAARIADAEHKVRGAAVKALAKLGATGQVPAIVARLADENSSWVRIVAVNALEKLGATDQAPAIAARLADENSMVRRVALDALEKLGATDHAPAIAACLADKDFEVRGAAVNALEKLGATDQAPAIAAHLANKSSWVRIAALRALAKFEATDQAPAIAARLADEDHRVRIAAVEALVELGATGQALAIAARFADEIYGVRMAAKGALVKLGAIDQAPAIAAHLANEDKGVRLAAVDTLAKLGAIDQAPAIVAHLADKSNEVRGAAVYALAELGATDQVPAIAARLADENYGVRMASMRALAKLEATDQIPAIAAHIANEDIGVRLAAVEALAKLEATGQAPAITARLADEDNGVRIAAVNALAKLEATGQAPAIAAHLANEDKGVRIAAVNALAKLEATGQAPAITAHLANKDSGVRLAAVEALEKLGATDQASAIAARLADENIGVRIAAVNALEKLGATDQAPAIAARLADENIGVRIYAVRALATLEATDQAPAIVARLADEEHKVRGAAVDALAKLDATDQIPAIAVHLADKNSMVRLAALDALAKLNKTDQIPAIAARLADKDSMVRGAAVDALAKLDATDQIPAIAARLADAEHKVRGAAVDALAKLDAADQIPAIAARLVDAEHKVRGASVNALTKLGATGQAPAIVARLADEDFRVRIAAVEALVELGATDQAPVIAARIADEDHRVRRAALNALRTLADLSVTDSWRAHLNARLRSQLITYPGDGFVIAATLVEISSKMKPKNAVAELVEALKHPVLGREYTTGILLKGLRDRFPQAPGPDRGLYPNLQWIKSNYPNIDLKSSPSIDKESSPSISIANSN